MFFFRKKFSEFSERKFRKKFFPPKKFRKKNSTKNPTQPQGYNTQTKILKKKTSKSSPVPLTYTTYIVQYYNK